eukprot:scaffold71818_cov15-Tisochrysis_lutea.AAC.1
MDCTCLHCSCQITPVVSCPSRCSACRCSACTTAPATSASPAPSCCCCWGGSGGSGCGGSGGVPCVDGDSCCSGVGHRRLVRTGGSTAAAGAADALGPAAVVGLLATPGTA